MEQVACYSDAIRVLIASLRGTSGIATYTISLASGLASAGLAVVLLDETDTYVASDPQVVVEPLRPPRALRYPFEPAAEWGLMGEVRRLAREHAVDGIHATRPGFVPRGERIVITAWDPIVSPLGRFQAAIERGEPRAREGVYAVVDAYAALRASAIVAVTPAVREAWSRFGRCVYVPPFVADESIEQVNHTNSREIIMIAGLLDMERKGLDLGVEAVARVRHTIRDARLVLVGGWLDPRRRAALPDFCEIRGRLESDQLRSALHAAGCAIIPSMWEEFGYTGLEALASGTPVACVPLPGYESLSGGGVFVAKRRGSKELARQIQLALSADRFEFPVECRASVAIPQIVQLYRKAFGAE